MNYTLLTRTACGPGVTVGNDNNLYVYTTIDEAVTDLEELDDEETEIVPIVQGQSGDWFDTYGRNLSEVARRQ